MNKREAYNKKVIDNILKQAKKVADASNELKPKDLNTQYFYMGFLKAYVQVLEALRGYKL